MSREQLHKFFDLVSELSPENLHEDGEISIRQARQKEKRLLRQWNTLENEVGRRVTEEEVWKEWLNKHEQETSNEPA